MNIAAKIAILSIFLPYILFIVIACFFQKWLSKLESPYPGLILPAISLYKISFPFFAMMVFRVEGIPLIRLIYLLLGALPTGLLVWIYYKARQEIKKKDEMQQMEIKDL